MHILSYTKSAYTTELIGKSKTRILKQIIHETSRLKPTLLKNL